MRLQGKVALVTGSSRGIGRGVAFRFADEGADIVINYEKNDDRAAEVVKEIAAKGRRCIAIKADVGNRADVDRMIAQATRELGRIDIVVSNAGVVHDKGFLESTPEEFESSIHANLWGFFNVTQAVLPQMIERRWGRIIATGSLVVESTSFGGSKYPVSAASKGGIMAMIKPLAREFAPFGVTVNSVSPGYIQTDMIAEISQDAGQKMYDIIPVGHYGTPADIAAAMAFLASDDAAYVTGQILGVNGGATI